MSGRSTSGRPACPPTPASAHPRHLGFEPKGMVPWFHPMELVDAGLVSGISSVFGSYADRREVQAALKGPGVVTEFAAARETWIDFAADMGDGWNPTYAVAWHLAKAQLAVRGPSGATHATERGALLVLGGDQVYPTASPQAYADRFQGPYRAALPYVPTPHAPGVEPRVEDHRPRMFAIPGNHDWYDGLTSFLRLFCQGRWIGGWLTSQERSYFALRLPHNWWLWGIDIQLHADIDQPQLDYFTRVASGSLAGGTPNDEFLKGHRIILCTAQPSWVHATRKAPGAYQNLDYFERKIISAYGGRLALTLTGDIHHYARYVGTSGTHKITAGGAGAYLAGTHDLPETLVLGESGEKFRLADPAFPDRKTSKRLALGALRFPFMLMNLQFTMFLALLYLLQAWTMQSSALKLGGNLMQALSETPFTVAGFVKAVAAWVAVLAHTPSAAILALAVVIGLGVFASQGRRWISWVVGLVHGVAHLAVVLKLTWIASILGVRGLHLDPDSWLYILGFTVWVLVIGGAAGGLLMAVYLVASNRLLGLHANEVFVTQVIQDFKCFLRMKLAADGSLTIFPIGLRRVPRKWRFNAAARNGEPWFEPAGEWTAAQLIEDPITIEGSSRA